MEKIYQAVWIDLPRVTRQHLSKVFGLTPTGIAEIRDTTVISDGYTNDDLSKITAESMARYVGSTASFSRLWELTLAKVKYELNPPIDLNKVASQTVESISMPTAMVKGFCDKCTSKGVRHRNGCPNKTF